MPYEVLLTVGAQRDLEAIYDYIAEADGQARADHVLRLSQYARQEEVACAAHHDPSDAERAELVVELRDRGELSVIEEGEPRRNAHILCSLGLSAG